jgi:hypothetical protein
MIGNDYLSGDDDDDQLLIEKDHFLTDNDHFGGS